MYDVLLLILKSTLTMSVVGLCALLISPLLSRRYSSRGLYALWLVILVGFLIPLRLPKARHAVTVQLPAVVSRPIQMRPVDEQPNAKVESVTVMPEEQESEKGTRMDITPAQILTALYLAGVAVSLGLQLARHARFMRTVRRWAQPVTDAEIRLSFARANRAAGVRRGPALARCAAVESPVLVGIFHPRILLPPDAAEGEALTLVLRHELTHYRRGDLIVKAAEMLVRAAHWFNPMAYAVSRMTSYYCELSCDARAMQSATIGERALYSHTILNALRRPPAAVSALTTSFSADKKTLKRRLASIMDMKTRKRGGAFALCAVILTLVLGTSFALADTTPAQTWDVTPMTKEEMLAIYQDSFDRMGTTSAIYYNADELVGADELETWLAEFNQRYEQETGRDHKEDMIISTTPGAHDMPYEEALAYAKELIMDTYGTPEEELDAMGVYPRFIDYVYMEDESEWEFFFTPMRDCDIDEDHDYPGEGEYRVTFTSPSKEVLLCLWYIDDFWPYAQRTWDAGKRDVVYEQSQKATFYLQDAQSQAHFTQLLTEAGYDMSSAPDVLAGVALDMMYADPAQSVLLSEDADVQRAMAALEAQYGLSARTLDAHNFTAYPVQMETGTKDYCVTFNYELDAQRKSAEDANLWLGQISYYSNRLGSFLISLDAQTGEVTGIEHKPREANAQDAPGAKLLEKSNWTAEDLKEFDALCERIAEATDSLETNYYEDQAAFHSLMREAGGDAQIYSAREPSQDEITPEQATEVARQAVMEREGLTQEEFEALYQSGECSFEYASSCYHVYFFTKIVAHTDEECRDYYVRIDAKSGEVLNCEITLGNG